MPFTIEDARAMSPKQIDRFYSKIKKGANNECWLWTGYKNKDGYGHLGFMINKKKKMVLAHRLSYMLATNQEIPDQINHLCNNPACCRPDHLVLGTQVDNMKYKAESGRAPAILNEEKVSKIKDLLVNSEIKIIEIAKMFGVSEQVIDHIKAGRSWTHVVWPVAH